MTHFLAAAFGISDRTAGLAAVGDVAEPIRKL
jgi:hypothetical protein